VPVPNGKLIVGTEVPHAAQGADAIGHVSGGIFAAMKVMLWMDGFRASRGALGNV
jgi:hypothetical protein